MLAFVCNIRATSKNMFRNIMFLWSHAAAEDALESGVFALLFEHENSLRFCGQEFPVVWPVQREKLKTS